ncbi:MAG: cell division ATP-binding protein FtsE [Magnetococcales bacterium]|nr:cell division ATP-binding protein FtsE [Magnetococcales bacterium]MBF0150402.1 cell division ATP-binding protein FtsE [Magnetococcales bacterium]MBF0173969.1 cell division ATP-binding protein FtsE [Magnetococcales bacterium]MBF0346826.1 cell division ATP-binding protein FtsE [Magnetococcales bacterium]MBF0632120.1 cell division ATP-binding protein FtsE [Magnetococcales bacterium]
MVRFHSVSMRYPTGYEALSGVSFRLSPGSFHFLTGPSGAGKTSVLKLIYRAELASEGAVLVQGRNVEQMTASQLPALRRTIGVIFQDYKLLYDRSVFDNVALAMEVAGQDPERIPGQVQRTLESVGLKERMYHNPIALSGGEQQRVAIARATVNRPPLVIADEPTGNLDRDMGRKIMALFHNLHQQGITILIVTHDLDLATELGHPQIAMNQGCLTEVPGSARL